MKQRCLSGGNFDLTNAREQNSSELTSAGWINLIGTTHFLLPRDSLYENVTCEICLLTHGNRNFTCELNCFTWTRISTYEIKYWHVEFQKCFYSHMNGNLHIWKSHFHMWTASVHTWLLLYTFFPHTWIRISTRWNEAISCLRLINVLLNVEELGVTWLIQQQLPLMSCD